MLPLHVVQTPILHGQLVNGVLIDGQSVETEAAATVDIANIASCEAVAIKRVPISFYKQ